MKKEYDYFYGAEADQFAFYRIPKELMVNSEFNKLSSDAKILYGLLLDRMNLSRKNNWIDDKNRVYIIFTLNDAMYQLGKSHTTCSKLFKELEKYQLLSKIVRGLGKPAIIYLHNVFRNKAQILNFQDTEIQSAKIWKSRVQESGSLDFQNLAPNNNKYNNTYLNNNNSCCCSSNNNNIYIPKKEHIKNYINNNNYTFDPEYFYNYYSSRNWYIGNKPIENFDQLKSIMDNWQKKESVTKKLQSPSGSFNSYNQKIYSNEELEEIVRNKQKNNSF